MDKYDWEKKMQGETSRVKETAKPLYFTKQQGEYTVKDLEQFPEDFRCELIDGVIYDMTAPVIIHQILACDIRDSLKRFIQKNNGKCLTLVSPVDVHLRQDDSKTMVQPDVIVVCNSKIITKYRIEGAPDLVIEILSPSTRAKDSGIKLQKYMEAGVREYWLVDPEKKRVIVHIWDNREETETNAPILYTFDDVVPVGIFNGECQIDMQAVYAEAAFLEKTQAEAEESQ